MATFRNLDMGYDWTFTWSTFSKTEKIDQLTESITLGAITYTVYGKRYDEYFDWTFYNGNSTAEADKILGPVYNNHTTWTALGQIQVVPGSTITIKASNAVRSVHGTIYADADRTKEIAGFGLFSFDATTTLIIEGGWDGLYLYSYDD